MATQLTKAQLPVVLAAAKRAGLRAQDLQPVNPWGLDTPTSRTLQMAVQALDPAMAQDLMEQAEVPLSLAAAAFEAGVSELDDTVMRELREKRPATAARLRAEELKAAEAKFLEGQQQRREAHAAMQQQIAAQQQDARVASLNLIRMNPQGR
jgi:hypothetical protein